MLYNCKIINIEEEEITIKIGEVYITGFTNLQFCIEICD